jgi:hypothetical protein
MAHRTAAGRCRLSPMKQLELWRWRLRDHRGKVILTRAHLTAEDAFARDPGAVSEPGTKELREVPESAAELAALSPGKGIRSGLPARAGGGNRYRSCARFPWSVMLERVPTRHPA